MLMPCPLRENDVIDISAVHAVAMSSEGEWCYYRFHLSGTSSVARFGSSVFFL